MKFATWYERNWNGVHYIRGRQCGALTKRLGRCANRATLVNDDDRDLWGVCYVHRHLLASSKPDPGTEPEAMRRGAAFFRLFLDADCPRVAVENPIMHRYAIEIIGRRQDQVVQPWMFGDPQQKAVGLWLRGVPPILATGPIETTRHQLVHKMAPSPSRSKDRSRFFPGIAAAMADQWGMTTQAERRRLVAIARAAARNYEVTFTRPLAIDDHGHRFAAITLPPSEIYLSSETADYLLAFPPDRASALVDELEQAVRRVVRLQRVLHRTANELHELRVRLDPEWDRSPFEECSDPVCRDARTLLESPASTGEPR